MYLVPRLVGIGTYCIILFFMTMMARQSLKSAKKMLVLYLFIVGLMGYFFVPPPSFDITRIILRMNHYAEMSVSELFSEFSLTPGEKLYYWIIGKFNNDKLLSCISGLISFAFCFSIFSDQIKKKDNTASEISIALFLFMARGSLMMAISNIRSFMVFSIVAWCTYMEIVNKKSVVRHIPLYIWACSMHAIGYALVIIKLLFAFLYKEKNALKKIATVSVITILFVSSFVFLKSYWTALLDKAFDYYQDTQLGTGYAYFWEAFLSGVVISTTVYLLINSSRLFKSLISKDKLDTEQAVAYKKYSSFCWLIVILDVLSAFIEYSFFMRIGYFLAILNIPLSLYTMRFSRLNEKKSGIKRDVLIMACVILVFACARGYLCSLKFFE